jgi:ribosomal protein L40E
MSGRLLIIVAVALAVLAGYGYAAVECPGCGAELPDDVNFCSYCVSDLSAPTVICTECGAENEPGAEICIECGAGLPAVEYIECTECGAVLTADAESCDTCGAKFPGFVWEIDFGEWTEGPESGVEIVGSQVYKVEDGDLVMGDGDGRGDEMRAGFTVALSGFKGFEISGKFSIPKEEGGWRFLNRPLYFPFDTSGSAIKITLIGGTVGYGLWAFVDWESRIVDHYRDWKEFIIKEEGDFFKGSYYKGTICGLGIFGKGDYVYSGFDLKGPWAGSHDFSFSVSQGNTTMRVDDNSFDLPSLPTTDVKLLISVYDDLIAEVWDLKVEALPE